MSIREDSQKIIQHFLYKAIELGELGYFPLQLGEIADILNKDENYCNICLLYLEQMGYIHICPSEGTAPDSFALTAGGINFLETT